ncbi:alpha/beta hydrolase [Hymenobacter sp. DG25B]|uniref:alpha/beta hydrolase n=1 Tax=Hymenobacter sp. DG25B TaxID=1385664 RepID=UPI0012DFE9F4|nr:alpha/beta hydrolase [Hymenobacter sp. DG25B]
MRSTFFACLLLLISFSVAFGQRTPGLAGQWAGTLKLPNGGALPLLIAMQDANGRRTATLDVPSQGASGILVDQVLVRGDSVLLAINTIKARYAGRLSADGRQMQGFWRQNNARLPLTLVRSSVGAPPAAAAPATSGRPGAKQNRPQEPVAPFPYREEEVKFTNRAGGVTLGGTLTVPPGAGPFPAVVLLSGSGAQDRDESVFGHRPFRVIADYLTRRGIAVLRFDDRGVGQSTGNAKTATAGDYTTDAQAALAFLRTRREINGKQLGLIGHSEGGTAAIAAAGQPQGPAFLVLLATPGVPGPDLITRQALDQARLKTTNPKILAGVEQRQRNLLGIVQRIADNNAAQAQLVAALIPPIDLPPEQAAQIKAVAQGQAALMVTPAYRYLLNDNPQKTLKAVRCPVLALGGSKDLQVASCVNLPAIEKTLKAVPNRDVTVKELPGLNHLFQTANTGGVGEYAQLEETFSPTALKIIGDWVTEHTKR